MNRQKSVNGVVSYPNSNRTNDYLFRVSLKAVVISPKGEVLIVKEDGRDWWDTPGGGLDHGETIREALARELFEEVGYRGDFRYEAILAEDARYQEEHNLYQMRLTFLVLPQNYEFSIGSDSDEIAFVNPEEFKNSDTLTEQKIYEYSQLAIKRLASF